MLLPSAIRRRGSRDRYTAMFQLRYKNAKEKEHSMKHGLCIKCGQEDVYRSEVSPRSSDRVTLKEGVIGRDASSVTRYVAEHAAISNTI